MKKSLAFIFAGIFSVSALFGCGSSNSSTSVENDISSDSNENVNIQNSGGITMTLYGNADDLAKPYYQKIISLYEESSGNKIEIQGLDSENAENIALTKFTTGDIPDLYIHFGNADLKNFNPEDNFVDFSDAEWVSDIEETVLPQAIYNDIVLGLPFWEFSNSGCIYNKQIFDELGIEQAKSQQEFDDLCDILLQNGIQPIFLAGADSWPILYQFAMDPVVEAHPEYVDKLNSGEMNYSDIPEFTSMCEWFKSAAEKGYFGETYVSDKWDYTSEVLGSGEAAMIFCWDTWFDTDYDNDSYEYKIDDFGIMPIFMGTCDEGTYEGGNVNIIMANKNSDNVEEAINFINFMAVPDNYNAAFEGVSTAAVFKQETTNVNSSQYLENKESVDKLIRASGFSPKVIGFDGSQGAKTILEMMMGELSVSECIQLMDDDRNATREAFIE